MNKKQFLKSLKDTYDAGLAIVEKKNTDYATDIDPWKNFRFAQMVGVPVDRAILVRMSDKLARISNTLDKGTKVLDETTEDTLLDLINYAAILKAYLENGKK